MSGTKTVTEEVTEYGDGSESVTTTTVESEYIPSDDEPALVEAIAEVIEEPVTDNEVAIAAIEAEARVAEAAIHADARVEEAAIHADANRERDEAWQTISRLEAEMGEMRAELDALRASPISSPLEAEEVAETIAEELEDLTPPSTLAPTSETLTEASQESGDGKLALDTGVVVDGKAIRVPIIQLV
jgi:cell division septum initiation protein DivIVA